MNSRHGEDLRVAVIGYGLAGAVFHSPLISSTPGFQIAAIVTANHRGSRVDSFGQDASTSVIAGNTR